MIKMISEKTIKVICIDKNDTELEYHQIYDAAKHSDSIYVIYKPLGILWEAIPRTIEKVMTIEEYRNQQINKIIKE